MNALAELLVNQIVASTIVAALVLLVLRSVGEHRQWLAGPLWSLVAIRLLVPTSFGWNIELESAVSQPIGEFIEFLSFRAVAADDAPGLLLTILLSLWGVAGVAISLATFTARRRFRRLFARASHGSDSLTADLLKRECDRFGITRSVELRFGSSSPSAFTLGTRQPKIHLPATLLDEPHKLEAVLVHELVHVARFDDLRTLVVGVIRFLYPLHPVAWLVCDRLAECREIACDQRVISSVDLSPASYGRLLLEQAAPAGGLAAVSGLSRAGRSLERRLEAMGRAPSSRFVAAGVVVFGLLAMTAQLSTGVQSTSALDEVVGINAAEELVSYPKIVERVQPVYPEAARRQRLQGKVVLRALIGVDGKARNIEILEGEEILAASAGEAVEQWLFEPARSGGEAVEVLYVLTIQFRLE